MTLLRKLLIAGGLLAGVGFAGFLMFGRPDPQTRPRVAPAPTPVDVVAVRPGPLQPKVLSQGTVSPRRQISLFSRVAGQVVKVSDSFAAGSFVREGELLVQVETADYEIAVSSAKARLANARQNLASVRGEARQARKQWKDLGDADANALFLRKPQLESAEAQVNSAEADVRRAQLDLKRTEIRVPFDARIRTINVNLGQFVSAGSQVASIYGTDVSEVRLPMTDRQLSLLSPLSGGRLEIPVDVFATFAGRQWRWRGNVVRSDASINVSNRLVYLIAEIPDPYSAPPDAPNRPPLVIGQFVEAEITGRRFDDVIRLPRTALRTGEVVWWVDGDRLRIAPVHTLQSSRTEVLIENPFPDAAEREVVISTMAVAVEGMRVLVRRQGGQDGEQQRQQQNEG